MALNQKKVEFNIAPKVQYAPLYLTLPSGVRIIDLWGGRGRGGSHEATLYALYRFQSPVYSRVAFVRKIYGDIRTSLWQDFKDRITETDDESPYQIVEHEMRAFNPLTGNMIKAFGAKAEGGRTAKLKSIAGYNVVIIEEAEEFSEEEFDQLDDSLRTTKGDIPPIIIRIFNPPGKRHWIWNSYNLTESEVEGYWKASPKSNSGVLSIFGTYHSNITNIAATKVQKWEGYKQSKPWYYYTVIKGLISEGQKGRIYRNWQTISDAQFQEIDAKSNVYWLDFGWSESPMAFGEAKFINNSAYIRELLYEPMTLKELAIKFCELGISGSELIIADAAEKDNIYKLRTGWAKDELTEREIELYPQLLLGFNVVKCFKGLIKNGIASVQDMAIYATEESTNIWAEYQEYVWALDKDKNPTDKPVEGKDHHLDGIRYVITGRGRLF